MLILVPSLALAAEPVGSFGATLDLSSDWVRSRQSLTAGPDQFHTRKGTWLIVVEVRNPMLEEADAARALERFAKGIEEKTGGHPEPPRVTRRRGRLEGETRWTERTSGVEVAFEVRVVGRDGLAYLLVTWSKADQRVRMQRDARRVADSLTLPGPDSAWARQLSPVERTAEIEGWTVTYGAPPAFLEPKEDAGDAFAALGNADGSLAVYLLREEDTDADAVVAFAVDRMNAGAETPEVRRSLVTVDGRAASVGTFVGPARGEPTFGMVAAIPLDDHDWMDVRMIGRGTPEAHQALWNALLASIDIEPRPALDLFPETEPLAAPLPMSEAQASLLGAGTAFGTFSGGLDTSRGKTAVYSPNWNAVQVLSLPTGTITELPVGGSTGAPAERPDGLYIPTKDGVKKVVDGAITDAGFPATTLADAGDRGLLLVRKAATAFVPGYSNLERPTGPEVVLRGADGQERVVTRLPGRQVAAAAVHGDQALLVTSDAERAWFTPELELLNLTDGGRRTLEPWTSIEAILPGPEGWLVTGTPLGAPAGVWALSVPGERSLLLSGRHAAGVPLDGGDLLLISSWHAGASRTDEWQTVATRLPAAAVTKDGAAFDPLTPGDLSALATDALTSLGWGADPRRSLQDAASIRRFVATADKLAVSRIGVGLPADAAGVDRLLGAAHWDASADDSGSLLLVALLSDTMIRAGATWVTGRAPVSGAVEDTFQNDHAIGWLPADLVRSTLHDDEGWWDPATTTATAREGRAAFIGLDPAAVRARVEGARRAGIEKLDSAPPAEIVAWLQVEPANVHLREAVYRRLAAVGRAAELSVMAAPFLGGGEWADVQADLVGRGATLAPVEPLIADVRAAFAAHRHEPGLLVLLAASYERAGDPALARECWSTLYTNFRWSPLRDDARAAIVRLGGTVPEE